MNAQSESDDCKLISVISTRNFTRVVKQKKYIHAITF